MLASTLRLSASTVRRGSPGNVCKVKKPVENSSLVDGRIDLVPMRRTTDRWHTRCHCESAAPHGHMTTSWTVNCGRSWAIRSYGARLNSGVSIHARNSIHGNFMAPTNTGEPERWWSWCSQSRQSRTEHSLRNCKCKRPDWMLGWNLLQWLEASLLTQMRRDVSLPDNAKWRCGLLR